MVVGFVLFCLEWLPVVQGGKEEVQMKQYLQGSKIDLYSAVILDTRCAHLSSPNELYSTQSRP